MNARTSLKGLTVTKEQGSVTDSVCKVGLGVVFAFAIVVGVISFISLGSGLATAIALIL